MYGNLCKPRLLVSKGKLYQIGCDGDPPQDEIDEAYAHIQSWVVLAISVVRAEFPSWGIMQAFSIFNPGTITVATGLDEDTSLLGLAQAFCLPACSLIEQCNEILPAAMK